MGTQLFNSGRWQRIQADLLAWLHRPACPPQRQRVDGLPGSASPSFHTAMHTLSTLHRSTALPCKMLVTQGSQVLRVVRYAEKGEFAGMAGRMRISGRMADVCAELDRLAAREAV
jgi:hypothetical protein